MKIITTLILTCWASVILAQHSFQTYLPSLNNKRMYGAYYLNSFETATNYIIIANSREEYNSPSNISNFYFYNKAGEFLHSQKITNEADKQLNITHFFAHNQGYILLYNSGYQSDDSLVSVRIAHYNSSFELERTIEIDSIDGFLASNYSLNDSGNVVICYSKKQNQFFGYSINMAKIDLNSGLVLRRKKIADNIYGGAISFNHFSNDSSYLIYSYQGVFKANHELVRTKSDSIFSLMGAGRKLLTSNKSLIYNPYSEKLEPWSKRAVSVFFN